MQDTFDIHGSDGQDPTPLLDFERLDVYRVAVEFHALAASLRLPPGRRELRDQLDRAALSIVLNTAILRRIRDCSVQTERRGAQDSGADVDRWRRTVMLGNGFVARTVATLIAGLAATASALLAQSTGPSQIDMRCKPASERTGEIGCHILVQRPLPRFGGTPLYWHLDTFASRSAAEAAVLQSSTIVEAHGKVWLLTLGPHTWRPSGGDRVAAVGPLPVTPDRPYEAQFMESVFPPGTSVPPHQHPGPEAIYMLGGEACAETPAGAFRAKAGESLVLPRDTPMTLHMVGAAMRRSLVLILHDAGHAPSRPVEDWKPLGLCQR